MSKKFPHVSPALARELAQLFPDRCPEKGMSDREVWMAVGAAEVVRFLTAKVAQQEDNLLGDDD